MAHDMRRVVRFIFLLMVTLAVASCAAPLKPSDADAGAKPQATVEAQAPVREVDVKKAPPVQAAAPEPAPVDEAPKSTVFVNPFPGVRVRVNPPTVEIESVRCLDVGWLEQVACMPGTREHEALVVVDAKPSHVHAGMLMAGFEPGAPGKWIYHDEEKRIEVLPPTGALLKITMRYESDGKIVEEPASAWIRDHLGEQEFPNDAWVFAGSLFEKNPEFMGPGEHYVADQTGSIIGLVTFGDEVIAYSSVIADQVDVQPAEWEVDDAAAPPIDTKVTIVITPWG